MLTYESEKLTFSQRGGHLFLLPHVPVDTLKLAMRLPFADSVWHARWSFAGENHVPFGLPYVDHACDSHDLDDVISDGVVAALETWTVVYSGCGVVGRARCCCGRGGHSWLAKLSGIKAESRWFG